MAGRIRYPSWAKGLNPNVQRIRTDQTDYIKNLLASQHGSVLEHANYSFILQNVSRILTHEIVRHRVGVAISQESQRYVRLDETMQVRSVPSELRDDEWYRHRREDILHQLRLFQTDCAEHFQLDNLSSFEKKKLITSSMRDFAPQGVLTSMLWTANVRTLRHCIEQRTAPGAEREIQLLFGQIAAIMVEEAPLLFADFTNNGYSWIPTHRKV